jgi:hypothetical protein
METVQKQLGMVTPMANFNSNPVFQANPARPVGIYKKDKKMMHNGRPFKGNAYPLKNDDPQHMQPQLVRDNVKVVQFNSLDPENMVEYARIYERHIRREVVIGFDERNYNHNTGGYDILIQYAEAYYTNPSGA